MAFDPAALIDRLPPFAEGGAERAILTAFCNAYGLPWGLEGVDQTLGHMALAGSRIAVHRWWPEQAVGTLLIVHGYLDHHGLYRHLIRWGLERGLAVVAFDLPGHGLSSGPRAEIDSFRRYRRLLVELEQMIRTWGMPRPLHLLGQSTGCAVINHLLLEGRLAPDGQVVLLAPLVRAARWRMVEFTHRLIGKAVRGVPRRWEPNTNDPDFNRFLKQDPLQADQINARWIGALRHWLPKFLALPPSERPVLIVQGEQDETVDWRYNLGVLLEKFPRARVLRLPEARHQLANEAEPLRRRYLDWIDSEWAQA